MVKETNKINDLLNNQYIINTDNFKYHKITINDHKIGQIANNSLYGKR